MKIKNIRFQDLGERVRLVADCKMRAWGWDEVYFEFDSKYKDWLVMDASPFVAVMLMPSMRYGQDLEVEGEISETLYNNLQKLMGIVVGWPEMRMEKVGLKVRGKNIDEGDPKAVALSFSAGIDSFYTLLKHQSEPDRITHLITIDGFDIDLRNKALWEDTAKNVRAVAAESSLEVIEARTNVKELLEPMLEWTDFCGGGLASIPICLRNGIRMSYLASGFAKEQQFPSGSSLEIDHLWSSEKFTFVHDGAEARRVDKVINLVGNSPLALRHLRVCHDNLPGEYNCGHCDKCMRTMVSLTITNTLDKAEVLPKNLDLKRLAETRMPSHYSALYQQENLKELEKRNLHPEIQRALREVLSKGIVEHSSQKEHLIAVLMRLDHIYTRGFFRKLARPFVGNKF